jgi:hypothetical protein
MTAQTPERALVDDIVAELFRARRKFPGKDVTFAALVEEVGELAKATFEESRARVRKEAVQVAVMAMRMVLDGDHTFDDWRASKGLDPLIVDPFASRGLTAAEQKAQGERCGCRGADDMCPCQNVPDRVTRLAWQGLLKQDDPDFRL